MSKAQERGLREALEAAAALDQVLRQMSDGRLGIMAVVMSPGRRDTPPVNVSWAAAQAEWRAIARNGKAGSPQRGERDGDWAGAGFTGPSPRTERFCSVCGPLDEPGVHIMADCPAYQRQRGHDDPLADLRYGDDAPAELRGSIPDHHRVEADRRLAARAATGRPSLRET